GRTGGNIIPFTVTIGKDGRVATSGPVQPTAASASHPLRNGLAKLAQAEAFFSMPTFVSCAGVNPDVAGRFITVTARGKTRTVTRQLSTVDTHDPQRSVSVLSHPSRGNPRWNHDDRRPRDCDRGAAPLRPGPTGVSEPASVGRSPASTTKKEAEQNGIRRRPD